MTTNQIMLMNKKINK